MTWELAYYLLLAVIVGASLGFIVWAIVIVPIQWLIASFNEFLDDEDQ